MAFAHLRYVISFICGGVRLTKNTKVPMRMKPSLALAIAAIMTGAMALDPALATEGAGAEAPSPDACRKTVHAMGASMGDAEQKAAEWGLAYHFVVRTNGIDYDVLCDAKTGLVKDVARRMEPGAGAE
jgi:hypothetical protein